MFRDCIRLEAEVEVVITDIVDTMIRVCTRAMIIIMKIIIIVNGHRKQH